MDDWKLNTSPVVRLKRPNKTFVCFVYLYVNVIFSVGRTDLSHSMRLFSVWPMNVQYQSEAAAYRLRLC